MSLGTVTTGLQGASGGGASVPEWSALPAGTEGDVSAVVVDGEICVAERGATRWQLRAPSAGAQAYAAVNPMPPGSTVDAYRLITSALVPAENSGLPAKCWGLRIVNRTGAPVNTIRIGGRNTMSGHAQIQGAWIIGGTLNTGAYQGTTHQRMTFAGGNTLTPANGSAGSPVFWATDTMTLSSPLADGAEIIIRAQTASGNVSGVLSFTGGARPGHADIAGVGLAIDDGDFGSSLATVQTNPAGWYGNLNGFIGLVELGYQADTEQPLAVSFGDSVIGGYIQGSNTRDAWTDAADDALAAGSISTLGVDGYTVQQYCQVGTAWLGSLWAEHVDSVTVTPWSWNNTDADGSSMGPAVTAFANAITAAGKRAVLWIDVPSSLNAYPYGNNTTWDIMRTFAQGAGLPLIETWQAVATGGTGPTIAGAYTGDGVHLNTAGQALQGAGIGAQGAVLFP